MKRVISLVLMFSLLLGAVPANAAEEDYGIGTYAVGDQMYTETEPNDTPYDAEWLESDDTFLGELTPGDIDLYWFEVTTLSDVIIAAGAMTDSFKMDLVDVEGEVLLTSTYISYEEDVYTFGIGAILNPGEYFVVAYDTDETVENTYLLYMEMYDHEHAYEATVKPANCTEGGYVTFDCACGDSYIDNYTPATEHLFETVVTEPTCNAMGYTTHVCICGESYVDSYVPVTGEHSFTDETDTSCDVCGYTIITEEEYAQGIETIPMHRLYNPNSGEHHYTGSIEERDMLVGAGWQYEGVAWNAPVKGGEPVYRLFNPNSGDHHYTMSGEEVAWLVNLGWQYENICWNSASPANLPLYRMYNPNAICGSHHYTGSTEERDMLVEAGWHYEGIGWYGMLH